MRAKRTAQNSLFDPQAIDHPVADDLKWASRWLDAHPELLDAVAADLDGASGSGMGRHGLTCETVLRCAVLVHLRQASYRELAFALVDSFSARRFARLDPARRPPGKSVPTMAMFSRLEIFHGRAGAPMGTACFVDGFAGDFCRLIRSTGRATS